MQQSRLKFVGWWFFFGSLAAAVCALFWPAAHLQGEYLPVTNDSFYHARRILDTAADPAAFYQFDSKIHAPAGSLLCWPWGYDYALGWLVRIAGAVGVPGPPIAFLIWIPVAAVFLSVGLVMLIARRLGLSAGLVNVAALCVVLSPLTTLLHGVGMIDHHYAEYIFVLATLLGGLNWFARPASPRAAVTLGLVLGFAPVIHNGSFILQIPVLIAMFLFWLQGQRLPLRSTLYFAAALLAATIAILIPSLPAQLGRFEFYTLSWFHLYVAAGTTTVAVLLSILQKKLRNLLILAVAALLLLAPLGQQALVAQSFLAGTIARLSHISEMRSVLQLTNQMGGMGIVSTLYSLLIWLTPLTFGYCLYRGWTDRANARLFFWVCCVLGLTMLVTQFRLHYFGSYALFLPLLVWLQEFMMRRPQQSRQIVLTLALSILVVFAYPLRYFVLAAPPQPASDPNFDKLRPVLETLKQHCATAPGIVLADNDVGHYIRYYTECSVIANNFLLTRQHEESIDLIDHLTSLSAAALPAAAPYVRYVLMRPASIEKQGDGYTYMSFSERPAPLINELLLGNERELPGNYELLGQADIKFQATGATLPMVRLYEIKPAR